MAKITNTGELREMLASVINGVANGTVDVAKANSITKLAGQLNESLYAEVKVARLQIEMGNKANEFGKLGIQ